ncbi:hypothetical protein BaRGS_00001002 [Batillaria attramentaria]|uniref:Leucine-rich melanocyte differentiation-associated protein n=1 Tax=Batillaria attramentaria TaxID=370345 RepID=A0ABD0M8I7_9CAEN
MEDPSNSGECPDQCPENEEDNGLDRPVFADGQLSYLGNDVEEIPTDLITEYADRTVHLDLSFNRLRNVSGLDRFTKLRDLILDNNELGDDVVFPQIRTLSTLFLNKNRITDLDPLIRQLRACFPNLTYLSLLGNTACPNQLSSVEKDDDDYQRYRYYVLYHLPQLKFLDSSAVQVSELREAKQRGQFMQVVRPSMDPQQEEVAENKSQYSPLPQGNRAADQEAAPLGFFGKTKYVYYGRHSEGNRFIRNKDL